MERREFVRVRLAVPVRYKLVRPTGEKLLEEVFEGSTVNLSAGGLFLSGRLPDSSWIQELLAGRARVALNLALPGDDCPIKAMGRVAWMEAIDEVQKAYPMGITFEAIDAEAKARIQRHVIRAQLG